MHVGKQYDENLKVTGVLRQSFWGGLATQMHELYSRRPISFSLGIGKYAI